MSRFREVVFATMAVIGGFLFLIGMVNTFNNRYSATDAPIIWPLCFFLGMPLGIVGAMGLLVYTESRSEYGIRRARQDRLEREAALANAQNLETAGRLEQAAEAYEKLGLLADAGRARSAKRTIGINGTVGTGQTTVIKEKETIVKEVVMIPCKYCGGLMDQTSESCPQCGARRRA